MKLFSVAALAVTLVTAPAYATTTFAQYEQIDGGPQTIAFDTGTLADTGGATGALVLFNYLNFLTPELNDPVEAYMNVSATGAPYGGTISFLRVSDSANLLTLIFTGATLAGAGGSGALFGSTPGGTVIYSSDFLDFTGQTAGDFAIGLSAITPGFGAAAWTADSVGTFATDSPGVVVGIPEPATWAMMIIGFGGVGALSRRRRAFVETA